MHNVRIYQSTDTVVPTARFTSSRKALFLSTQMGNFPQS